MNVVSRSLESFEKDKQISIIVEILPDVDSWKITYKLKNIGLAIYIPELSSSPNRQDNLWQTTCFEIFIKAANRKPYVEWNFSPTGDWACYFFHTYREQGPIIDTIKPHIITQLSNQESQQCFSLEATIPTPKRLFHAENYEVALCSVTNQTNGSMKYWALKHAPSKPDFHHETSFQLRVRASNQVHF